MELYITYNEISCRYPTTNLSILTTSLCVHSDFCSNANGGELKIARVLVLKLKLNYPNNCMFDLIKNVAYTDVRINGPW